MSFWSESEETVTRQDRQLVRIAHQDQCPSPLEGSDMSQPPTKDPFLVTKGSTGRELGAKFLVSFQITASFQDG